MVSVLPRLPGLLICVALVCVGLIGCDSGGIKTVPVQGKITYGGGDWPADCEAFFACEKVADGFPMQAGTAKLAKDGSFKATTENIGPGLVPGTYVVNLICWETPPSMENPSAAKSYLPEKFRSGQTAGFRIEVPADAKGPIIFNENVPKE